jgi:fatty-acid peroxygenase
MKDIPRPPGFDHSLRFLREGYDFVANRCNLLGSDIFETRLGLRRAICMRGAEAAEFFYAGDRFTRVGAMPITILMLLQDYGSVQLLDGNAHHHRKAMFRAIGRPEAALALASAFKDQWKRALPRWEKTRSIILFDEVQTLLTRAGAAWAGVPLSETDARLRTREFSEMLASTGTFGPRTVRALLLRQRTEHWMRAIIARARSGSIVAAPDTALQIVANHRDLDGKPLSLKTAAVELINVLRAIVAVGRFIAFAAKALHEHSEARALIASGDTRYLHHFVQEIRRTAPFFPVIGGRARRVLDWKGYRIEKGAWVLLDLYGTNHDARTWIKPATFDPSRYIAKEPGPYDLVPQGAGDAALTHRCPGEDLTLMLMKAAMRELYAMRFTVEEQDLSVDKSVIPALPASGVVLSAIRREVHGGVYAREGQAQGASAPQT